MQDFLIVNVFQSQTQLTEPFQYLLKQYEVMRVMATCNLSNGYCFTFASFIFFDKSPEQI
jgi:hypothetical protein